MQSIKYIGRAALRDAEDIARREHEESEPARKHLLFNDVMKSFAADARGDEADDRDERTSVDELAGNDHHASKVADLLVESGQWSKIRPHQRLIGAFGLSCAARA